VAIPESDVERLERKIDVLTVAVNRLAVIDERQIAAGQRMGALEDRVAKMEECEKKDKELLSERISNLDGKVNRLLYTGVGMMTVLGTLYSVYVTFRPIIHVP